MIISIKIKYTHFNNRPKNNVYYLNKRLLLIWRKPSHYVSLRALFHLGVLALSQFGSHNIAVIQFAVAKKKFFFKDYIYKLIVI
jgi:hypothetical protein